MAFSPKPEVPVEPVKEGGKEGQKVLEGIFGMCLNLLLGDASCSRQYNRVSEPLNYSNAIEGDM